MDALIEICEQAHQIILPYWKTDLDVQEKMDDSPVTKADKAANESIVNALEKLFPEIPTVSEEGAKPELPTDATFWLIDPLDGTKSFIKGRDEFTTNIALVENRKPVIGILGLPAKNKIYKAVAGQDAFKREGKGEWEAIKISARSEEGLRVVSSLSHCSPKLEEWLAENGIKVQSRVGAGSALKFGLVAEGLADIYPRIGPTMEWDTAAGHCIAEAAGATMTDLNGAPFLYGKKGYLNGGFLVRN